MKKLLSTLAAAAVTTVGVFAAGGALAQAFPERPITIIVPFAAGGPTDKVARDFAEALRGPLGNVSIVVENVAGAGGTLGPTRLARATPDGYTLGVFHIGMATTPALYRRLQYQPLENFEFLGMINDSPMTLISRPNLPANNYAELVSWIRDNRTKVNLANAGLGSASHLCGLMFQNGLGIEMTTVPYKGTGPAMTDLLGGQVDIMCDQTTNTTAQIEAKRVKGFAVTTPSRLTTPALKDLPTLQEVGLKDFNVSIWHGLYAPKGTPPAVMQRLNAALQQAVKNPRFVASMEALGAIVVTDNRLTMEGHRSFVASEIDKWGAVIKAAGQYAD
jgi:tripartite-type tricarboxylate transporter receptor subunit TctC